MNSTLDTSRGAARHQGLLGRVPQLTGRGLTILLALIATVPVLTVFGLYWVLPAVHQGELAAEIRLENVPPDSYYEQEPADRPAIENAAVVVTNTGDDPWTNFYIRINRYYEVMDREPIDPGESRRYRLDRFVARVGAVYDVRLVRVRNAEIYARVPSGARHTYERDFE